MAKREYYVNCVDCPGSADKDLNEAEKNKFREIHSGKKHRSYDGLQLHDKNQKC